ncbi:MAG: hypothetical protein ABFC96_02725 [Thermoguttaceae bacterium]
MNGLEHGTMSASTRQVIFRKKLQAYVGTDPVGVVADRLGIRYPRFHRWLTVGIERPHRKSFDDLKRLAGAMGLNDWNELWEADPSEAIRSKIEMLLQDRQLALVVGKMIDYIWLRRQQILSGEFKLMGAAEEDGQSVGEFVGEKQN